MKLVVTDNFPSFLDYCRENGLDPSSRPRTVRFVQSYKDFMGVDNAEIICYSNWRESEVYKNPEVWKFLFDYARAKSWKIPDEN